MGLNGFEDDLAFMFDVREWSVYQGFQFFCLDIFLIYRIFFDIKGIIINE